MKGFSAFQFDHRQLLNECTGLESILQPGKALQLDEDTHLSLAMVNAKNVLATIAMTYGGVAHPNLWAKEFWFFDQLRCDFAYGDSRTGRFCFIEIEDARAQSIFVKKNYLNSATGQTTPYFEWAPRFDHGTSQLLDWIRLFMDQQGTQAFKDHFGHAHEFHATFILIIGRQEFLDESHRNRLAWRSKHARMLGTRPAHLRAIAEQWGADSMATIDPDELLRQLTLYSSSPAK